MHRSGPLRRLAALLAIAALEFAQAVTAAHACMLPAPLDMAAGPMDRTAVLPDVTAAPVDTAAALPDVTAASEDLAAAPADVSAAPCHESHEPAPDALCKAHCETAPQSVDQAKPLAAPDAGAPLLVLRAGDLVHSSALPAARLTDWLAHAGAPPPILLHRRLRI